MAIRTQTGARSFPLDERPFPKLMIADDGDVVLMFERAKGIYLKSRHAENHIGEIVNGFAMGCFKDFDGSITLQNE